MMKSACVLRRHPLRSLTTWVALFTATACGTNHTATDASALTQTTGPLNNPATAALPGSPADLGARAISSPGTTSTGPGAARSTTAPPIDAGVAPGRSGVTLGDQVAQANQANQASQASQAGAPANMDGAAAGSPSDASAEVPTTTDQPTWTHVYDVVFASSCGSCHGAAPDLRLNGGLGGLSNREAAFAALVGEASSFGPCGNMPYVTPSDASSSLLYLKLTTTPPCGMRMPLNGQLGERSIALVEAWIAAGANND